MIPVLHSLNTISSPPPDKTLTAIGKRVLMQEADALRTLADSLGTDFTKAVQLINAVRQGPDQASSPDADDGLGKYSGGRLIVSGMGKSGHIGRKIAATLASVGTPAFYVHPAEASHGDLGMIMRTDVILALSRSGETGELHDMVDYAARFSVPLIAMTIDVKSTLAAAATAILRIPNVPEACPLGLAPTTSTTMMLALGDALAVTLLEQANFTPKDFQVFHPGGKLGQKLYRVRDLMHTGAALPFVHTQMPFAEVMLEITRKRLGCTGVTDTEGALVGVITDGDLRRAFEKLSSFENLHASDVMNPAPLTIAPDTLAREAVHTMNVRKITSLFVLEENLPIGILHIHDCLHAGVD